MVGYDRSRSKKKVLTPKCGHVRITHKFPYVNTIFFTRNVFLFCM